jgi:hypothetical protein
MMKRLFLLLSVFLITFSALAQHYKKDSAIMKQISNHILSNAQCYEDLRFLSKRIGHRLSGSPQAEKAVYWGKEVMEKIGCDRVFLQEVMVPHWIRGEEKGAVVVKGKQTGMRIMSLGNAVGTGDQGIQAALLKIDHIDELKRLRPEDIKGKIVFYNFRFDQTNVNTFESYGPCVYYRWGAPSEAAKRGAVAVVIRSVSSAYDNQPHTGTVSYEKDAPAIPAVAISNVDADILEQMVLTQPQVGFYIRTTCQMLNDVKSYNVVGELQGSDLPNEIISFGGHLDSWDVGEGSHDDGAGVVQAIEVLRVFKELGIRPKRTIRAVLYMNEENGLRGAKRYAELAKENNEYHILAIESDAGGATPYGFSMEMEKAKRDKVKSWASLFMPYNVFSFDKHGGGADIGPMKRLFGTPVMGLMPDSQRYFDMHHSDNDVFENVHRRELSLGAIAMAHMVYLVSLYGL